MLLRNLYIIIIVPMILLGQGPMNGYGIGSSQRWQSPSQGGMVSLGMAPSFQNGVSLSNPSTWHQLKYTHFSIAYYGLVSDLKEMNVKNGFSTLQSGQLIIPIKQSSALGVGIHPYTYQQIALLDTIYPDIFAYGDTLGLMRGYYQAGGIIALDLSVAMTLFEENRVGATFQLLFGSSRQHQKLFLNQVPITESSRMSYSGLNIELFFKRSFSNNLDMYFQMGIPVEPLDVVYTDFYPFDDTNLNTYHDYKYDQLNLGYDFPHPQDTPNAKQLRIKNIYQPVSLGLGLSRLLTERLQLSIEMGTAKDFANYPIDFPTVLNHRINTKQVASIGCIWLPNNLSVLISDKFTIRSGLNFKKYILDGWNPVEKVKIQNIDSITEFGGAIGFGFKFKAVGNQVDISYYYGVRQHPSTLRNNFGDERVQQFQVGLSLADLWFVKRRQR